MCRSVPVHGVLWCMKALPGIWIREIGTSLVRLSGNPSISICERSASPGAKTSARASRGAHLIRSRLQTIIPASGERFRYPPHVRIVLDQSGRDGTAIHPPSAARTPRYSRSALKATSRDSNSSDGEPSHRVPKRSAIPARSIPRLSQYAAGHGPIIRLSVRIRSITSRASP